MHGAAAAYEFDGFASCTCEIEPIHSLLITDISKPLAFPTVVDRAPLPTAVAERQVGC